MSEGRLAKVREADRHAALLAGSAAALSSAGVLMVLRAIGLHSQFLGLPFWAVVVIATMIGFGVGACEAVIASRYARRAAFHFVELSVFGIRVGRAAALANSVVAILGAGLTFTGEQRIVALIISLMVAIGSSAAGAAVFAWSHAADWPQIPDFISGLSRTNGQGQPTFSRPLTGSPIESSATHVSHADVYNAALELNAQLEATRREIVDESRVRHRPSINDAAWSELQAMLASDPRPHSMLRR